MAEAFELLLCYKGFSRVAVGGAEAPQLRSVLFDYIEIFYNRDRSQAGLGHLSPFDYEAALVVA